MYDTIGNAINYIESQTKHTKEEFKPSLVLMVIVTDGQENASVEYSSQKVKLMINELENNDNWQFIYMGADLNNISYKVSYPFIKSYIFVILT